MKVVFRDSVKTFTVENVDMVFFHEETNTWDVWKGEVSEEYPGVRLESVTAQ